ncbi:helix-turn-helix domain-containing protein [Lactococcus lactis]|jgi:transcriptional regulator with XRE-family HTH domain|uniref:helix-turn-helix domain-containing protein n=1 Tax=Lactococcus lactis TaxID=1358 RepID=UPI000E82718B|nr:helix-turn-helix transcriptional regulator [Lactococcus lactis]HAV95175.1 hypothetical protein [Lactococcus lactis]
MIGKKIKEYRLNLKLTGATLANLAGINQPYLSQIENEKKIPPFDTFMDLIREIAQNAPIIPENSDKILTEDNFQLFKKQFTVTKGETEKEKYYSYSEDGDYDYDFTGHNTTLYTITPNVSTYSNPISSFYVRDTESFELEFDKILREFYLLHSNNQEKDEGFFRPNLVDFEINETSADLIYYVPQIRASLFEWWYNKILSDIVDNLISDDNKTIELSISEGQLLMEIETLRNANGTFSPTNSEHTTNLSKELLDGKIVTFDFRSITDKNVRALLDGQLLSNDELTALKFTLNGIRYNRKNSNQNSYFGRKRHKLIDEGYFDSND